MDFAITNLINFSIVGFALVMIYDFATGLHRLWFEAVVLTTSKGINNTATPDDQKGVQRMHTPEAKDSGSSMTLGCETVTLTRPAIEDVWLLSLEPLKPTEEPCCCSAIARSQLLLPAGIGGTDQPDIATHTSTQLRRMCSEKGIPWRNQHGTKHLSKGEMISALSH